MSLSQFKIHLMETAKTAGFRSCNLIIPNEFQNIETLLTPMEEDHDSKHENESNDERPSDLIVHKIIQLGRIDLIKKELLTHKVLLSKNKGSKTSLGLIIQRGQTKEIPKDLLTKAILLTKDANDTTHIHLLASYDQLGEIDPKFLTGEFLSMQNKSGLAPIHLVKNFATIPCGVLTKEIMRLKDKNGRCALHHAALNHTIGILAQTKADLVDTKSILVKDDKEITPAHLAAEAGIIWQIPKELITKKVIEAKDHAGNTIMHYMARSSRSFKAIPTRYLNKEHLCKLNNWGICPLELTANTDPKNLQTIPLENITTRDLKDIESTTDNPQLKSWSKSSIKRKTELENLKKKWNTNTHEEVFTV